jgi:holo-[acyl-carrier protein] synthase
VIGIDVVSLAEVAEVLLRSGDAFLQHSFSADERAQVPDGPASVLAVATRFAMKEAVFKTLGRDWPPNSSFADIVITTRDGLPPRVELRGPLASGRPRIEVSVSVAGDLVLAIATITATAGGPCQA